MKSLWERLGRIEEIDRIREQGFSRPQLPTVLPMSESRWRLFFCARDQGVRSHILSVDLNPLGAMRVIDTNFSPLVPLGDPGSFDQDASAACCFLRRSGAILLYYAGGRRREPPWFEISMGLLVSRDDGVSFQRASTEAVLGPGECDPYTVQSPCVLERGAVLHVWYTSTRRYDLKTEPTAEACYHLRHAQSSDGVSWVRSEEPVIDFASEDERGLARPWVQETSDGYEMWFASRGRYSLTRPELRRYRIGYATSSDGMVWTRDDAQHGYTSPPRSGDWDQEMQCYQCVVQTATGEQFMFYSGNGYGEGGIGFAVRR